MKIITCTTILLLAVYSCTTPPYTVRVGKPKLVVGIVVDQMRNDYLYRYYNKFGEGGFKRFVDQGFVLKNGHYNYIPTKTGPGHASVYTGTTPANHGIIGNDWYDRATGKEINCVEDTSVLALSSESRWNKNSPINLLATTIADALKLATNMRSKSIGISLKNRGAILPVGHTGNGAFWYERNIGKFISSTYYYEELPDWVNDFNDRNLPDQYLSGTWNILLPIADYTESTQDNTPYEKVYNGKTTPTFPYNLQELKDLNNGYSFLRYTPFGNTILLELSKAVIEGESLGQGSDTDFLAISFSSPDHIGHDFGPYSIEVEDMYLRLDMDIAELFNYLDDKIGANNYLVFLTADHGVANVPQYSLDNNIPAGIFQNKKNLEADLEKFLNSIYGQENWIEYIINQQLYLDHNIITSKNINLKEIESKLVDYLMKVEGVSIAYTAKELMQVSIEEKGIRGILRRGYNENRSGDVIFGLEAGWVPDREPVGTTHGSGYKYDTHVPILFYGWGIPHGETVKYYAVTDIAPTLSMMLDIQLPSMSTGKPIEELFE